MCLRVGLSAKSAMPWTANEYFYYPNAVGATRPLKQIPTQQRRITVERIYLHIQNKKS